MLDVEEEKTRYCDEVVYNISFAKIGTMTLIGGEIFISNDFERFVLKFTHENEQIEMTLLCSDIVSAMIELNNTIEKTVFLSFRPSAIKNIGKYVEKYNFAFHVSKDKSDLDFVLNFDDLPMHQILQLEEFFKMVNANAKKVKMDVEENENNSNRKKKLYDLEVEVKYDDDDEIPKKRQRKNSKDRRTPVRKTLKDENVSPRRTRRTRANYSKQSTYVLEDISEEQQYQEALRLSLKTHKKEKANGVNYEDSEITDALSFPDVDKDIELFTYPTLLRGDLTIKMEDYLCLSRNEYLNDVDIDFYLEYIFNEKMTPEQRSRTYIFGSHFYSLYATSAEFSGWKNDENAGLAASEKRYMRVDGIIPKDVNLFDKDFLIIPLMDRNHWFLAIVCYPGLDGIYSMDGQKMPADELKRATEIDGEMVPIKVPCVLIFDSINGNVSRRNVAMNHIKIFLRSEYDHKYKNSSQFVRPDLVGNAVRCPLQLNNYDCGCFLLEFVERFLVTSPFKSFRPPHNLINWFDPKNIGSEKRREIADVFKLLMGDSQIILPEIKFKSNSKKTVNDVIDVDNISNNNNDNNVSLQKEYNNNNFNCLDINNPIKEQEAIAQSQFLIIASSSEETVNKKNDGCEKVFDSNNKQDSVTNSSLYTISNENIKDFDSDSGSVTIIEETDDNYDRSSCVLEREEKESLLKISPNRKVILQKRQKEQISKVEQTFEGCLSDARVNMQEKSGDKIDEDIHRMLVIDSCPLMNASQQTEEIAQSAEENDESEHSRNIKEIYHDAEESIVLSD